MSPLPFGTRVWFAWACFFRVLFDGAFAERAWAAREPAALPRADAYGGAATTKIERQSAAPPAAPPVPPEPSSDAALQLLALLQREGRLVDFLQQDIASHGDADVGAAARVVHEGCRKALRAHVAIEPVRDEEEGARVKLESGFDPDLVKLTGAVKGSGPFEGVLRHRGWRAGELRLPKAVKGHDVAILCPAEVEL